MLKKANLDIIETSQELRTEHISLVVGVSSCFEGVFKKVLSTSPFFSNFKNSYSNLLFCETSSRGANKVIVKKEIHVVKTPVVRNVIYYISQKWCFTVVLLP